MINVYNEIAPSFYDVLDDVLDDKHTHYMLKGGRGSTKSSFVGEAIPLCMVIDAQNGIFSNAVVLRKVGETLEGSVYSQLVWGIEKLGLTNYFKCKTKPLEITYILTGQTIKFRSANNKEDYKKIKSIKFAKGFCKYVWYEEVDEFFGMDEIRNINVSLLRGGAKYKVFYTFNPPKMLASWINAECLIERADRLIHSSTYLTVPKEWLGEQFFIEAEELKKSNYLAYRNEFLGEATGTGGAIFDNIKLERITDEDINKFDNIIDGIDFGFAVDPSCYLQMHYDKTRKNLYIFSEIYKVGLSNGMLANEIKAIKKGYSYITCDSAEPKSIAELKSLGLRVKGAKKGADSIDYGIKYLQKLNAIIIDKERCPNTAREFSLYEYEKDKYGNFISRYPDFNNHSIDCTRYAIEDYTIANTWQANNRKLL